MKISKLLYVSVTFTTLSHLFSKSNDITLASFPKTVSFSNFLKNLKSGLSPTGQLRGSQGTKAGDQISSSLHVLIASPGNSYPGSQTTTISVPETNVSGKNVSPVVSLSLFLAVRSPSDIAFLSTGISRVTLSRFLRKIFAFSARFGQGHTRGTQSGTKPIQVPFAEHCNLNSVNRL